MAVRPFQFASLSRSASRPEVFFLSRLSATEFGVASSHLQAAGCSVLSSGCSLGGSPLVRGRLWVAFSAPAGVLFRLASQFPSPDPSDLLVFHPSGRCLCPLDLAVLSARGLTYTQLEQSGFLLQSRFSRPPVVRVPSAA